MSVHFVVQKLFWVPELRFMISLLLLDHLCVERLLLLPSLLVYLSLCVRMMQGKKSGAAEENLSIPVTKEFVRLHFQFSSFVL